MGLPEMQRAQNNHLKASLIKSILRLAGYGFLFGGHSTALGIAAIVLIFSEFVGIVEELV